MQDETIELISEKIDHLYAMHMAGYSVMSGMLCAILKQGEVGRKLDQAEFNESMQEGHDLLLHAYKKSLHSRSVAEDNKPT